MVWTSALEDGGKGEPVHPRYRSQLSSAHHQLGAVLWAGLGVDAKIIFC